MTATAVLVVDGVLRAHTGEKPLPGGLRLYHGLKDIMSVVLVTNDVDLLRTDHWLRVNGLTGHPHLLAADPAAKDAADVRVRQVGQVREWGGVVDFVVEPDPRVAEGLLAAGIPSMVYTHPRYSAPDHRPDYNRAITPWSTFVEEIERVEALRLEDTRTEAFS